MNYSLFDFRALFPDENCFTNFISALSDDALLSRQYVKILLQIQKDYFRKPAGARSDSTLHCKKIEPELQQKLEPITSNILAEPNLVRDDHESAPFSLSTPDDFVATTGMDVHLLQNTSTLPDLVVNENSSSSTVLSSKADCHLPQDLPKDGSRQLLSDCVQILNLPSKVSKRVLKKTFHDFGKILRVEIIPESSYAILTFEDVFSAERLLNSKKCFILDGCLLKVTHYISSKESQSEDFEGSRSGSYNAGDQATTESEHECPTTSTEFNLDSNRVLYVGNIPFLYKTRELLHLFSKFGSITSFDIIHSRRKLSSRYLYGFLTYENARSATGLLRASRSNNCNYRGHKLVIQRKWK